MFWNQIFVHKQSSYVAGNGDIRISRIFQVKSRKKKYIFTPRMIQLSGELFCCCRFALPYNQEAERRKKRTALNRRSRTRTCANKESPMIWQFHVNFINGWTKYQFHGILFALCARTFATKKKRNARAFVMCTRINTLCV